MIRAFRGRLYQAAAQEEILKKISGSCRFVYNCFLSERIRAYRENAVSLSCHRTAAMLTELKHDGDHLRLSEADSMALQERLRGLERAYDRGCSEMDRYSPLVLPGETRTGSDISGLLANLSRKACSGPQEDCRYGVCAGYSGRKVELSVRNTFTYPSSGTSPSSAVMTSTPSAAPEGAASSITARAICPLP